MGTVMGFLKGGRVLLQGVEVTCDWLPGAREAGFLLFGCLEGGRLHN